MAADYRPPITAGTQAAIDAEASARASADTALAGTVATETTARIAADVTLTTAVGLKASSASLAAETTARTTEDARTDNPHAVTKTQVGLGNADNTSDANKPVSTATATALAAEATTRGTADTALDGRLSTVESRSAEDWPSDPFGTIAATNLQDAIEEVFAEASAPPLVIPGGNLNASSTMTLGDREQWVTGNLNADHVVTVVATAAGQRGTLKATQTGAFRLTVAHGADTPILLPLMPLGPFDVEFQARSATDVDISLTDAPGLPGASITGSSGSPGPGLAPRGPWSAGTAYVVLDMASYLGSTYVRVVPGTTATDPATDTSNWALLVAKGATGSSLTPRGAWSAGTAYSVLDFVTDAGASYARLVAGTTGTAPGSDPTNWALLASRGATGPAGPGLIPRGNWSAGTAYNVLDFVNYSTTTYVRMVAGTTATTPDVDTTNWGVLAVNVTVPDGTITFAKLAVSAQPRGMPSAGEECLDWDRATSTITLTSGSIRVVYFRARVTEIISQLMMQCGSVAATYAGAGALARLGIYEAAADWSLGNLHATVADTTMFLATGLPYARSLATPLSKIAGQWYGFASLIVTTGTAPTTPGLSLNNAALSDSTFGRPRKAMVLAAQTDFPATIAAPNPVVQNTTTVPYGLLVP